MLRSALTDLFDVQVVSRVCPEAVELLEAGRCLIQCLGVANASVSKFSTLLTLLRGRGPAVHSHDVHPWLRYSLRPHSPAACSKQALGR